MTTERKTLQREGEHQRTAAIGEVSSPPMIQSWLGPFNEGKLDNPDGWAVVTGPCGDTMEFSLMIEDNRIVDSRYRVQGCSVSRACASIAASLARGKELEEAYDISEEDIATRLQRIPIDHAHCPVLARDTLRKAIEHYFQKTKTNRRNV